MTRTNEAATTKETTMSNKIKATITKRFDPCTCGCQGSGERSPPGLVDAGRGGQKRSHPALGRAG